MALWVLYTALSGQFESSSHNDEGLLRYGLITLAALIWIAEIYPQASKTKSSKGNWQNANFLVLLALATLPLSVKATSHWPPTNIEP